MDDSALYANTINITNNGMLDMGNSTAAYLLQADTLNLTSATDTRECAFWCAECIANNFVLNADLTNDRTNDTTGSSTATAQSR